MVSWRAIGLLCLTAAALALAGCGAALIPDEEVAGMAGTSTAGPGGDLLVLGIFGSGKSVNKADVITLPFGSLTYDYAFDYLKDGTSVEPDGDTWDELTLDGSAELVVDLPNFSADRTLGVSFDVTGFNDSPNDGRVLLGGSTTVIGFATWTNPKIGDSGGYTMDLTKTWTDVDVDDPSEMGWTGYPASGTVRLVGTIERHREGPSGSRTGAWEGTLFITFNGTALSAQPPDRRGDPVAALTPTRPPSA